MLLSHVEGDVVLPCAEQPRVSRLLYLKAHAPPAARLRVLTGHAGLLARDEVHCTRHLPVSVHSPVPKGHIRGEGDTHYRSGTLGPHVFHDRQSAGCSLST